MNSSQQPEIYTKVLANQVLGMLVFILTEIMFFAALMSAYVVIKSRHGSWVPPKEIMLPVQLTAVNTMMLLGSGVLLVLCIREIKTNADDNRSRHYLLMCTLLASLFVLFQGAEWVMLIKDGMTISTGLFAACFYLLIGMHGLHAIVGIGFLGMAYVQLCKSVLSLDNLSAIAIYWMFVVGVWPLLYTLVYF